jgi:caa(3)-type oxidase subunit IV
MGHSQADHRKVYWKIFVWLFVLTVLEVGVVYVDVGKGTLIALLCSLAVVKAAMVGFWYMHLNDESVGLRWTVAIPMGIPVFYALVLIADSAWRFLR